MTKKTGLRVAAVAALGVVGLGLMAPTASAADNGDNAPHNTAPVNGLINVVGDINALNDLCVAPWHWDGPIQLLTDNGAYQACQKDGGIQTDAPAVDLSHGPVILPAIG